MNKIYRLIIMSVMLFPLLAYAGGFKIDVSIMEAIKKFDSLNIGSLAIGETGLVSIYGLSMCVENERLKILSISELDSKPSKYTYSFEVTRKPNNNVAVVFSKKGKSPDVEAVKQAVLRVISSPDCSEVKNKGIPLFSVTTFLGANSLKNLV